MQVCSGWLRRGFLSRGNLLCLVYSECVSNTQAINDDYLQERAYSISSTLTLTTSGPRDNFRQSLCREYWYMWLSIWKSSQRLKRIRKTHEFPLAEIREILLWATGYEHFQILVRASEREREITSLSRSHLFSDSTCLSRVSIISVIVFFTRNRSQYLLRKLQHSLYRNPFLFTHYSFLSVSPKRNRVMSILSETYSELLLKSIHSTMNLGYGIVRSDWLGCLISGWRETVQMNEVSRLEHPFPSEHFSLSSSHPLSKPRGNALRSTRSSLIPEWSDCDQMSFQNMISRLQSSFLPDRSTV